MLKSPKKVTDSDVITQTEKNIGLISDFFTALGGEKRGIYIRSKILLIFLRAGPEKKLHIETDLVASLGIGRLTLEPHIKKLKSVGILKDTEPERYGKKRLVLSNCVPKEDWEDFLRATLRITSATMQAKSTP
jgi:biotin operon repressor